jgi:hypothetical protein
MILMLEDDDSRIARFKVVLERHLPGIELVVWRDANVMIREASEYLNECQFICLDHDLEPESDQIDPGDGYTIAKWLTSQPFKKPVVIHSSNAERASWMAG